MSLSSSKASSAPYIYLSAELEVDHDDGDLRARDDENYEDKEQETKHVVELVLPDGLCAHTRLNEIFSKMQPTVAEMMQVCNSFP